VQVSLPRYLDSVIAALPPSSENCDECHDICPIMIDSADFRLIRGSFQAASMMFLHEFGGHRDQHPTPWMVPGDAVHAKPSMSQAPVGTDRSGHVFSPWLI
jgi:hypothetical protein